MFVASSKGGMDIEAVTAEGPSAIKTLIIYPSKEIQKSNVLAFAKELGFANPQSTMNLLR